MSKRRDHASIASTVAFTLGCALAAPQIPRVMAQQAAQQPVIYLNQAWSQEDREWYYNFSQGATVTSYDIFLNLEVADSQELFRSDANSERYGLIPQPRTSANPDGLPIGISKTVITQAKWKGEATGDFAGVTCAMCHNNELRYQGKRVRIDGGNNASFDLQGYIRALDAAMQATLKDPAKFERLAMRANATSADAKANLRTRFESQAALTHDYATKSAATAYPWGPARLDALTMICNRVLANIPGIPENTSTPIAPVKPPFLWNAPQGLWTQWGAFASDPLPRNFNETVGVYMDFNLRASSPADGLYASNAQILDLQRVENQLGRLAPPSWPEDVFGKIDRAKAQAGKALFVTHCAGCHNMWPYRMTEPNKYGARWVVVGLIPKDYVGTDITQTEVVRPFALTGALSDNLPGEFRGKAVVPALALRAVISAEVLARAVAEVKMTDAEKVTLHGYRELPVPHSPENVWKAAPRDGVWATGPFLHNGSVPNLYEMLIPAAERTKKFYVGRDFDPVKVGVDTSGNSGRFLFDTTLIGNSNKGHSFQDGPRGNGTIGPLLSEEERWALVEYLKSIPEQPGRVTPFGPH